jgi:glutaredoxin
MILLTVDGCEYCKKVKTYLKSKNINYEEYNLSKKENREMRKHYRNSNYETFPVLENDGWSIEGYNLTLMKELLNGK